MKLDADSTLDLSSSVVRSDGTAGISPNLVVVKDGGKFEAETGSNIRVNTENLQADHTLNGQINAENLDIVEILKTTNKQFAVNGQFIQIVQGTIGAVSAGLLNEKGEAPGNDVVIKLYEGTTLAEANHAADLVGGIGLVRGDNNQNLYVGQGIRGIQLHKTIDITQDAEISDQWIRADEGSSGIGLNITGADVKLGHGDNSFTGVVSVTDGVLTVSASGALGSETEGRSYAPELNISGSGAWTLLEENVEQSVGALKVADGAGMGLYYHSTLVLNSNSRIDGELASQSGAGVKVANGAALTLAQGSTLNRMLGHIELDENSTLTLEGTRDEGWLGTTDRVELGDAAIVFAENASGALATDVVALNNSAAAGTLRLESGAKAFVDETKVENLSGIKTLAVDENAELKLGNNARTVNAFSLFAANAIVSGAGTVSVEKAYVTLADANWNGFSGTLALTDADLNANEAEEYGFGANGGNGSKLTVTQKTSFKGLEWNNGEIDLSGYSGASASEPGLAVKGDLALADTTVRASADWVTNDVTSVGILRQDEGWDGARLISASGAVTAKDVSVAVGSDAYGSESTEKVVSLQTNVEGTYSVDQKAESGKGLSLAYKLKKLAVDAQNFVLEGTGNDAAESDDNDLRVALTGGGTIGIKNAVAVCMESGSTFSGAFSIGENSALTLSAADSLISGDTLIAPRADFASGATLTLASDVNLILGEETAGKINLGGNSLNLYDDNKLHDDFVLQNGSVALTGEGSKLALTDASKTVAADAVIELEDGAQLSLKTSQKFDLAKVKGDQSSRLDLEVGNFSASEPSLGANGYQGDIALTARLDLENWQGGTFANTLTGAGTVGVTGRAVLDGNNTAAFTGTWSVADTGTLTIGTEEQIGGKVTLADAAVLEFDAAGKHVDFSNAVNGENACTGILKVSAGEVRADRNASIHVKETQVAEGAVFSAASLDQLGNEILTDGTTELVLNTSLDMAGRTVKDLTQNAETGVLRINLGNTANTLANVDLADFGGELHLVNGTYVFEQKDYGSEPRAGFALGDNARFELTVADAVKKLDSFSFAASSGDNRGILDLKGYTGSEEAGLKVNTLKADGQGEIRLNPKEWLEGLSTDVAHGNLLDVDDGNGDGRYLIEAAKVTGAAGSILLRDQNGNELSHRVVTDIKSGGDTIAQGIWNYVAAIDADGSGKDGLKATYGLTEIALGNADEAMGALVLKAEDGADDAGRSLSALISGEGRIDVQSDVKLTNTNTFKGTAAVSAGQTLTTTQTHGLSNRLVTLELGKDANFEMTKLDQGRHEERLVLKTEAGASEVRIQNGELQLLAGSSFAAGTKLLNSDASAALTAEGETSFEDAASALQNYTGVLNAAASEGYAFRFLGSDESAAFSLGNLSGAGAVYLDTTATLADNKDFTGTLALASGRVLAVDNRAALSDEVRLVVGAASSAGSLGTGAVLDLTGRTNEFQLKSLETAAGSTIRLGTVALLGDTFDTGLITVADAATLGTGTTLQLTIDPVSVQGSGLATADNAEGVTAAMIRAESGTISKNELKLDVQTPGILGTGKLLGTDGKTQVGTVKYSYSYVDSEKEIGFNTKLESADLTDRLTVAVASAAADEEDRILSIGITSSNRKGILAVEGSGSLEISGVNTLGALEVAKNSNVVLSAVQTLNGAMDSVVRGQLKTEGEDALIRVEDDAALVFADRQNALNAPIELAGGKVELTNEEGGFIGTNRNDLLFSHGITGTTGEIALTGVKGSFANTFVNKGTIDLTLSKGADALLDASADDSVNLGTIQIGSNDAEEGSRLTIRTQEAQAVGTSAAVAESGTLRYEIDTPAKEDKVVMTLGALYGSGRLELSLAQSASLTTQASASSFSGTAAIENAKFIFGANAQAENAAFAGGSETGKVFLEAGENSVFAVDGIANIRGLKVAQNASLDLSRNVVTDTAGLSSNLIKVAEEGRFEAAAGSAVQVDTTSLTTDETINDQVASEALDVVEILKTERADKNLTSYKIVEGNVGEVSSTLLNEKGEQVKDDALIHVALYEGKDTDTGRHVADLVGGIGLLKGEGNKDLFVGQGINGIRLHETVTLKGDIEINEWIRNATDKDSVGVAINEGNVVLMNGDNSFSGEVTVAKGTLTLSASGALGREAEDRSFAKLLALEDAARTVLSNNVEQTVGALRTDAGTELVLGERAKLAVEGDAAVAGKVAGEAGSRLGIGGERTIEFASTADLTGMHGTIDLGKDGIARFSDDTDYESVVGSWKFDGGKVVKLGKSALTLNRESITFGTAIDVQGGSLRFNGWDKSNPIQTAEFTLGKAADAFTLEGDVKVAEGGVFRNNGTLRLGSEGSPVFHTRTIAGDYASDGGTVLFNASLTGEKNNTGDNNDKVPSLTFGAASDMLAVTGDASGSSIFQVTDVAEKDVGLLQRLVLMQIQGDKEETKFEAELADGPLQAGGYEYRLVSMTGDDKSVNWVLSSYAKDWDPNDPDKPVVPDDDRVISVNNGAFIGVAAAAQMFDLTIHDRQGTRPWINPITGEETLTSLWMKQTVSQERSHDGTGQLSMRNTRSVTQVGGDIVQLTTAGGGYAYAGWTAGYGTEDWKVRSTRSSSTAKSEIDGWNVGAYAGWAQNAAGDLREGAYLGGWVMYSQVDADITNSSSGKSSVRADGLSASFEAGWNAPIAHLVSDDGAFSGTVYVEPHMQASWWGMNYDDLEMNGRVKFLGKDNITLRLGARVSAVLDGTSRVTPYLEANWVRNTHDYGVQYSDLRDYQAGADNQGEFKFGAEVRMSENFSGYAQFRVNVGNDSYSYREGSIGLKYRF